MTITSIRCKKENTEHCESTDTGLCFSQYAALSAVISLGNLAEDTSWPENVNKYANIFICNFHLVVLSIFQQQQQKLFKNSNLNSSGHSHSASVCTNKEQQTFGSLCVWYFCPTRFVYDVTHTDYWAQMAAPTVMFSYIIFWQTGRKIK